jgi:hypothetical protein
MLHGVDPEAIDTHVRDPGLIDLDHAVDHSRMLGEEIVESEEITVVGVLADECRVAAVVVERDVVEPAGHLEVLLARLQHRGIWEGHLGIELREGVGAGVVAVVERLAGRGTVRLLVLGNVCRARAVLVPDRVCGVVGDDVEVDLHPARVRRLDKRSKLVIRAQVGVDLCEVGDPVAVVARRRAVLELHGLVLETGSQPDRRGALDPVCNRSGPTAP